MQVNASRCAFQMWSPPWLFTVVLSSVHSVLDRLMFCRRSKLATARTKCVGLCCKCSSMINSVALSWPTFQYVPICSSSVGIFKRKIVDFKSVWVRSNRSTDLQGLSLRSRDSCLLLFCCKHLNKNIYNQIVFVIERWKKQYCCLSIKKNDNLNTAMPSLCSRNARK